MPNASQKPNWFKTPTGRVVVYLFIFLLIANTLAFFMMPEQEEPKDVPLSEVVAQIKGGNVLKAVLDDNSNSIVVTLDKDTESADLEPTAKKPADEVDEPVDAKEKDDEKTEETEEVPEVSFEPDAKPEGPQLRADYPISYADTLTQILIKNDVPTKTLPVPAPSLLRSLLFTMLPILIIVGFLLFFMRSYGGIGKLQGSRGQQVGEVPTTRFSDVAGCDEAVTELQELVEFFSDGERFTQVGAKPPRGALLVGPPGTGKTLLARAVAGEAGVPFFALAGSDFVETFVGVGAKRVRELFDRARKAGSAIIFIDEIDAVGRARGGNGHMGGDSERENTLVSMLNEMDGFDDAHRIIVIAATNRADVLDPALTRPGRLDRQIQVPTPDRRGREAILKVHSRGRPVGEDVDYLLLARRTPGMSGAELEQVVNEACMEAGRRGQESVDQHCFDSAIATVALGRARTSALVTEHDRQITAWHEAGHTVAALMQKHADDPVSVSIIPRGPAGGVTWMSGSDDVFLTKDKALANLRVSMAGRAAEEKLLDGSYTQGAHGDLTSATNLAWAMVTKYGMSDAGYLVIPDETLQMGGVVGDRVRAAAESLLKEAHVDATSLLGEYQELLKAIAEALLDVETLSKKEILDVAMNTPGAHVQVLEERENEDDPFIFNSVLPGDMPPPTGEPLDM